METIPDAQVTQRMRAENPWWSPPHQVSPTYGTLPSRAYLGAFWRLVLSREVRRAALLFGPRRVGKTVLMHHVIAALLKRGVAPTMICYLSIDHPLYNGRSLDDLLRLYREAGGADYRREPCYIFFDEIQYLRDWERHLKALVDGAFPSRFVASGSAAAALRMKSNESGAGRFTDFLLPPLTFSEYLRLRERPEPVTQHEGRLFPDPLDVADLNGEFVSYLNFGGYPEVALSPAIQADPGRFITSDIIDKVLLRDLPGLYGIQDVQELNYLFTTLAYNSAQEVSLEQLASNSGVAKNTLRRYLEYLEAAFLIRIVHRIDRGGKHFRRANFFKVYLTNPSLRTALFSRLGEEDTAMGAMAETGIFAQWFHRPEPLHYARWDGGEVDIVALGPNHKPDWAVEVKWTDRFVERPHELKALLAFCRVNRLRSVVVTTRTRTARVTIENTAIDFIPASVYCYTVGANILAPGGFGLHRIEPAPS